MGILDKIRGQKDPEVTVYVNNVLNTIYGMDPSDLYETQDSLRAVVDFISDSIASCPLKVYVRKDNNDRQRDTSSDVYKLLKEPNSHQTQYDFINQLVHEVLLYGECAILRLRDADSSSGWVMEVIPQSWIVSTKTDGFRITYYKVKNPYDGAGDGTWIKAEDIIHIHGYESGKPGNNLSPVAPLKNILKEQISAWTFRNQVWERGGRTTAFITRPADAGEWTPEQRDRFVKAWKERYAGNKAPDAGSMPLFEDGMEIKSTTFNARETEWAEALKLSRESVAAIYHINPAMIFGNDKQTYASVKENARSLYVDCLGSKLEMISQAFDRFLLPVMGANENTYTEFDLQAKLNGSFEEQSDILVRSTGTAFRTINEARALMNLPRLDDPDADLIVKPLNVVFGGQASPLTPTGDGSDAAKAQATAEKSPETPLRSNLTGDNVKEAPQTRFEQKDEAEAASIVHLKGKPATDEVMDIASVFRKFYKRQRKSVLNAIDRSRDKGTLHEVKAPTAVIEEPVLTIEPDMRRDWYDFDRWERELIEDLMAQLSQLTVRNVADVLELLYEDPDAMSEEYIMAYLEDYVKSLSFQVNKTTLEELIRAVDDADSFTAEDALKSTPAGVFDYAEETRANHDGQCVATSIKGWSNIAAVHLSGKQHSTYKIWRVNSSNPRPSHMKMNGERIPYANPNWCQDPTDSDHYMKPGCGEHNRFSNSQRWPGDYVSIGKGGAKEVANCRCSMDLEVEM